MTDVQLSKCVSKTTFSHEVNFAYTDTWVTEQGIDPNDCDLVCVDVYTYDTSTVLTPEFFADTGYQVAHVYNPAPNQWSVYVTYSGVETYQAAQAFQELEGISSASFWIGVSDTASNSLVFETVAAPATTTTSTMRGDVSLDGALSMQDAVLLQKYALGLVDLTDAQIQNGDLDASGQTDDADAILLLRFLLQLSDEL